MRSRVSHGIGCTAGCEAIQAGEDRKPRLISFVVLVSLISTGRMAVQRARFPDNPLKEAGRGRLLPQNDRSTVRTGRFFLGALSGRSRA